MQSKLLILCLVLLTVVCSVLIGWICALTNQPVLWAAAPLVLFVTVLALLWIGSRIHARLAAGKLERGLFSQGRAELKATRPDQKQQVAQLHADFERAVRDLKTSKLGRAGRDALYLLPWYAIIGPSGAGKTTALRNSGLRFPSMRKHDNLKVRGVGGTRNCDFWLSNDAVLLDTAGRWSTQDDDHHEWLGFLQLLRKHRAKKPLNGMIAAIGIGDVVNATPEEVDALAERMRSRLEEVTHELRVSIPVYVLFTKCDLLEGFIDMFGGLRATDREQILGFTVPLVRSASAPEAVFENYFDELSEQLRGAALARMGDARGSSERARVYAFPEQFTAMRANLARFVAQLFENNVYRETVPLRGVYFSSGTQEGRPFNLLFEPSSSSGHEVVDQKGYFLRDLFMQVIFADSTIASASQAELRRQRALRVGLSAALGVLCVVVGVLPTGVFLRSRHQIATTAGLVRAAEADASARASSDRDRHGVHGAHNTRDAQRREVRTKPALSNTARALISDLAQYEQGQPSFFTSLGMYTGGRVVPPLRRYLAGVLRRELVQPILYSDAQAMTEFGMRYETLPHALPTPAEHDTFYAALKFHLLLSAAQLPPEYAAWVQDHLALRWSESAPEPIKPELARAYVTYAQAYPELAFARDTDVVRRVRSALTRASAAQQTLDTIVAHVSSLGYDLDLQKLTGYTSALTGARRVRGAFTRRGYENAVRELFETGAPEHVDELWVLGLSEAPDASDRSARLAELESLYLRAYVQEWRSFIEAVRTKAPRAGGAEALALISELTSGEPTPIARLLQGVAHNVRLPPPPKPPSAQNAPEGKPTPEMLARIWKPETPRGAGRRASAVRNVERFGPGDLAAAFEPFVSFGVGPEAADEKPTARAPVPFDAYREQLLYLRDALQLHLDNPAEAQQLERQIQTAQVRVRGLIDSQAAGFRPIFEALLWPPIRGLREDAGREGAAWLGQKWCSDVVAPFEQSLLGRYPFNANGHDARLDDLDAYYKPAEGLLWKFTSATLSEQVALTGDHFDFTTKFEHGGGLYNSELLSFLDRSRAIARAFYPGQASGPRVDFSVRIHAASSKVDTTVFSVGGKQISYDNGPLTWQSLSWPGPEPARGASFSVRGRAIRAGNEIEGVWGLFRLLEAGSVSRSSDDAISITWRLPTDDVAVWIELRPNTALSPFFDRDERAREPRLLRLVRNPHVPAPRRIATNQPLCHP